MPPVQRLRVRLDREDGRRVSPVFEAQFLPDTSKRALALELLEEFGASVRRVNDKNGEIVHGCLVSPNLHSDQDKNPTASLSYTKLTYNCLGCGSSGGLLWFIATCRGGSSQDARSWLEETAGLGGNVMELEAMLRFLDNMYAKRSSAPIPTYSVRALKPWAYEHPYLTDPPTADPSGRGIPLETIRRFQVGWDPEADRIVLPHFWQDKLVGWQTRKMPRHWASQVPKGNTPKYLSSPDFPKDATIFNYSAGASTVVVVESMMSVLRHVHALHMEATFGAKVTDLQIGRLVKHQKIVLWMDNDLAGWRAVEGRPGEPKSRTSPGREEVPGMAEQLSRYADVYVVDSQWMQDPGELPTEEILALVDSAVPWTLWRRPRMLYCYHCKWPATTHGDGPCQG